MRKISVKHDNKDRIICVSESDKHNGTRARLWLFDTKNFSGSVFAFFRKYGRCLDGVGFSMTVGEIYEVGNGHNVKINKILDRIPAQTEYVLRERDEFVPMHCITANAHIHNYDFNRVA